MDGKLGYIDTSGKMMIRPQYEAAYDGDGNTLYEFWQDAAVVTKNGKYGVINTKGEVILNFTYDSISLFNKRGLAIIQQNNKYGFVNDEGRLL